MATAPQILANRGNAQLSTGPKTEAGKASVSQNATSHGLSSGSFTLLPHENAEEFHQLLESLNQQFEPASPVEDFLVNELARAQWKLDRIDAIEARILDGAAAGDAEDPWAAVARRFQGQTGDALVQLDRYAASARRAWHKSLDALLRLRASENLAGERASRTERNLSEAAVNLVITGPVPVPAPPTPRSQPECKTKPIPAHLECELTAHRRRDPLFDPKMDAPQMSKDLRKWFETA